MLTLAIETATPACSAALIDRDGVAIAAVHQVVGRGHAERLVPMIAALIEGRSAPTRLLVDCGPGSFTGVRVGLAAARAFSFAWGAEVRGFSSLALIAAMAGEDGPLAVAIPGGHGELFVQRFVGATPAGPLRSLPPALAATEVPEAHVFGAGAAALVEARGAGEARELLPDAAMVARLAAGQAELPPSPIYGRAPDAKPPA